MSQAEFARAAGWSPSTISSWERGMSRPSRLAFKTILAFAEERGVRYQPKGEAHATEVASTLPVLRMPSRLPVEAVAARARESGGREESFGSRRWTEMAATGIAGTYDTRIAARPERSMWQAEATLQIKIGAGNRPSVPTRYLLAAVAALALGLGVGAALRGGSTTGDVAQRIDTARDVDAAGAARSAQRLARADVATDGARDVRKGAMDAPDVAIDAPVADSADGAIDAPDVAADALPSAIVAAELTDDPFPSGAAAAAASVTAALVPAPAALLARLESIIALDGVRRASFRVGDRSIALVEGDQLGASAVAKIEDEDVMLVGGSDGPRRIRLGFETPLD